MKKILVFNTGSSSLKFKLFAYDNKNILLEKKGEVDKIKTDEGPKNYKEALGILFEGFGRSTGFLHKITDLAAIGHRVVHGGNLYRNTQIVDDRFIKNIKKVSDLAPLHNPAIIEVMEEVFENCGVKGHRVIPNYAVFDTSFYSDMPNYASIYPIPYYLFQNENIQKFGFHGLSHKNSLEYAKNSFKGKFKTLISVHLGAGCSITAIKDSVAIDTSMGFTPLEGLMMGTRSGDIDPGIIIYLIKQGKFNIDEINDVLQNQSGLLGISEVTSDMKDLLYLAGYKVEDNNYRPSSRIENLPQIYRKKAQLALEMFIYRIKKYLGAYNAILGGTDVLTFTGNIGVGSNLIRKSITLGLEHIFSQSKILVIPTDEEMQIAKEIIPYLQK